VKKIGNNNEKKDCKIGIACERVFAGVGGAVNKGDEDEGIWLMDFIYYYKYNTETSCNCFK
jgi:hypothetical protein